MAKKINSSEAMLYTYMITQRNLDTSLEMLKESKYYLNEDSILLCEYIYKLNELRKSLEEHTLDAEPNQELSLPLDVMMLIADCAEIELEMEPIGNLSVAIH